MSTDFQKTFKNVGGLAFASVLLASCSQDWSTSGWFGDAAKTAKTPYEMGKMQMSTGHYGMAIESFRIALAEDPQSVKALNGLAATYDLVGRYDLAERYYRQALNLDPRSVQSLNNLGYSYFLRGNYADARTLFEKAARIDEKNPIVLANLESLEKADATRKMAADGAGEKAGKTVSADTPWIERTASKVQSLVTQAEPETLRNAREKGVEPRVVHTPSPVIEIATSAPIPIEVHKPQSGRLPAVAISEAVPEGGPDRRGYTEPLGPGIHGLESTDAPRRSDDEDKPAVTEPHAVSRPVPTVEMRAPAAAPEPEPSAMVPEQDEDVRRSPAVAVLDDNAPPPIADEVEPAGADKADTEDSRETGAATAETAASGVGDSMKPAEAAPVVESRVQSSTATQTAALTGDEKAAPSRAADSATKSLASEAASEDLAAVGRETHIEISNGAGRLAMAARMNRYLTVKGVAPARLTNAQSFTNQMSVLYFLPGHLSKAKLVSDLLPLQPELRENPDLGTHLRLVLGGDLLNFDRDLIYRFDK